MFLVVKIIWAWSYILIDFYKHLCIKIYDFQSKTQLIKTNSGVNWIEFQNRSKNLFCVFEVETVNSFKRIFSLSKLFDCIYFLFKNYVKLCRKLIATIFIYFHTSSRTIDVIWMDGTLNRLGGFRCKWLIK